MGKNTYSMPETMYRCSGCFRVLGNPTAYSIIRLLENNAMTPTELASTLGKSIQNTSLTLRHLRQINLVRYTTSGKVKIYRLKDKGIIAILDAGEKLVDRVRILEE
jgi:DNA-binding transcriptional ArsR family regulator